MPRQMLYAFCGANVLNNTVDTTDNDNDNGCDGNVKW